MGSKAKISYGRNLLTKGVIQTGGQKNPLLAYDPSGLVFALGLGNNTIRLYSLKEEGSGPFQTSLVRDPINPLFTAEWTKICFSNDGKYLLISTNSSVLYILDAFSCAIVHRFDWDNLD